MAEEQNSLSSKRLMAVALVAILGLIGVSIFLQPRDISVQEKADDSKQQDESDDKTKASDDEKASSDTGGEAYTYTAAAGDSYTMFARQAVAALGGSLSPAERVAAETKLTQDASEPYLEVGQQVSLERATVRAAVDWAASLSPAEKSAWQPYADLVVLPSIK